MSSPLICIYDTYVIILDCPAKGPEALDFRRANGLDDSRADNRHHIQGSFRSESQVRELLQAGYTGESFTSGEFRINAEERLRDGAGYPQVACPVGWTKHGGSYGYRAHVSPATIRDGDHAVLLAIAADSPDRQRDRRNLEKGRAELRAQIKAAQIKAADAEAEIASLCKLLSSLC